MGFQLPNFIACPVAVITDEMDPAHAEIATLQATVAAWNTTILAQLTVLCPARSFNEAVPNAPADTADQAARVALLAELRTHVRTLFSIYATGYAELANALVGKQPAAAPAVPCPPEEPLPDLFEGKFTTARRFMAQCNKYIALHDFRNDEQQIRWALALIGGDARVWQGIQLTLLGRDPVPAHLTTWDNFQNDFEARWTDPYEAKKAREKIMKGVVIQRTSVRIYNDQFNAVLALTGIDKNDGLILHCYTAGLKSAVRVAAIAPLMASPDITFSARQALMTRIDDHLMRVRAIQRNALPPRQTPQIVQTIAPAPTVPSARTSSIRAPQEQTPSKAEPARQYTRLTTEDREQLRRTGSCYYCREQGHIASQCPRRPTRSS